MGDHTNIEWCHSTFNAWEGCTKVGPGCDHCYAETFNKRMHGGENWGPGAPRLVRSDKYWDEPLKWERDHAIFFAENGCRRRVFCSSLADVFDNEAPAGQRMRLFELIAKTPNLDWLILTKRIGNVQKMCSGDSLMFDMIATRVWLGATIVNQEEADRDIPKLLAVPAAKRFLSMEPLLGLVDVSRWLAPTGIHCMDYCPDSHYVKQEEVETITNGRNEVDPICQHCGEVASWTGYDDGIDWVIAGGESGHGARPPHPDHARSLRDQCAAAGVPFLWKQWGEWAPAIKEGDQLRVIGQRNFTNNPQFHTFDDGTTMARIGKYAAGRLLDGVQHDGYPIK